MITVHAVPDRVPDDMGITEVRHPRRRFWGAPGELVGWSFWERYGDQVHLRGMLFAREHERKNGVVAR